MTLRVRKSLAALAAAVGLAAAGGATLAFAQGPDATAADSSTTLRSAVEDFTYPGATQIEQERGIKLKRGDGRLLLVSCAGTWDIMVESRRDAQGGYCFDAQGSSGYLSLELPDAFGIWTEANSVQAKLTADGETTTVAVPAHSVKPIGETDQSSGGKRSVLVELRVTG
ncbi:hypothetical protein [Streptomyces lavendulocolor]|uniref:hypothetical protein n=1 Tax=Streptomyces lavendulocolor TaxID=67316 RepID=UPI003C2AE351